MSNNKEWVDNWATKSMNNDHMDILETLSNSWMLRKCYCYYDEYKACGMIKTKIHDLFVHGELQSCDEWKDNFDDCKKWTADKDVEAARRVIRREEKRISDRLKPHHLNNVWDRRSDPPSQEEWSPPLPSYLQKNVNESIIGMESTTDNTIRAQIMNFAASGIPCSIM
ncbi:synaptic plasticity regulator PANTS [Lepeophtheirus salmonis]|uniref:synaptic plasticity regulator PANTS n=1 Tax=Lepeophtheirus salmonis TaxID=72036 RepID=UPI001AE19F02|nr:UPF0545 protein C22orf39 homolog [Lepeophtheirus salmonis]